MIEVAGNWHKGFAYDLHTLSSEFVGYDEYGNPQFDTTYSEMGALLHDLKYRGNKQAVNNQGKARQVSVLTMTKTRSNR